MIKMSSSPYVLLLDIHSRRSSVAFILLLYVLRFSFSDTLAALLL